MRWYAAATISLTLLGAVFGCGSDGPGPFIAPPDSDGGSSGSPAMAGNSALAGKGGAGHAGNGSSGTAGAGNAATGGDAGSTPGEAGSAGAAESGAGAGSVVGGNGGGGGAMPVPTVPSAPTTLALQIVSGTTVHVSWMDNASNETGYNVYWSTTAEKPALPNAQLDAGVTSTNANGLTASQEYNFWVEAYNDVGPSSDITGKATPVPVPASPTALTVVAGASDAVLTWNDAATGETGYRVYLSTTATQPTMPAYELAANAATYTVPGSDINAYTKYYYWVVAYNAVGESMAATGSGTTGVKPADPTGVVVVGDSSVWSVAVSWIDNADYSSSFNIYWSIDDNRPAQPGDTVPGGTNSYKMKSVLGNQIYRFWIEAVNPIDKSGATKGIANKPTFELTWTDLYYDPNANTIHHAIKDVFGLLTDGDATTGLFAYHTVTTALGTASALNPAINWNPATAGINVAVTQSFWSEMRTPNGSTFSVKTLVPPGAVTGLTATPAQLTVALTWAAASNAAAYQIYKAPGLNAAFSSATSYAVQGGNSLTVTDLNPGTPYSFWVRALGVGFNGTGLPSPTVTASITTTGTYIGPNLALGKTAVATSDTGNAAKVLDGNVTTRWQAASLATTEWIYVNLGDGNAANITHVKLVWETAYAKSYDIEVCAATCDDGGAAVPVNSWPWVKAYDGPSVTLSGFPNYQLVSVTPTVGQFIRMKPKTLGSGYGASLYEFEIFSQPP